MAKSTFEEQNTASNENNDTNELKINKNDSLKDRIEKQKSAHEFIQTNLTNPPAELNTKLVGVFNFLFQNITQGNQLDLINVCFEYDFCKTIVQVLSFYFDHLIAGLSYPRSTEKKEIDHFSKILNFEKNVFTLIFSYTNYSVKFCIEFQENGGIEALFRHIKSETLISSFLEYANVPQCLEYGLISRIVRGSLGAIINLGRAMYNFTNVYKSQNAVETLLQCSETLKNVDDCEIACYMGLALIADEEEIHKFGNIKQVIPGIVKIIQKMDDGFNGKKKLERISVQLNENDQEKKEINRVLVKGTLWHLVEVKIFISKYYEK